uniref:Uncharacterized protein n=1 Tax=Anopheles epiroticus TaxID=199890 RepID=A0A182P733_9DIPT
PASLGTEPYGPDDPVRTGYQALTLAAFRSPGLLGTHGFSFGSNFGFRDPSTSSPSAAYDPAGHPSLPGAAGSLLNLSQHAASTHFRAAHHPESGSPVNLYLGGAGVGTGRDSSHDQHGTDSPYGRPYHDGTGLSALSEHLGGAGASGAYGGDQEKTDQEDEINILQDGSRGNSPVNGRLNSSTYGSEGSPEPEGRESSSKHRREESCGSPLGSARSYSSQTKDGELVGLGSYPLSGSPHGGEDSVGSSRSPENLSHGGVCGQQPQGSHPCHSTSNASGHPGAAVASFALSAVGHQLAQQQQQQQQLNQHHTHHHHHHLHSNNNNNNSTGAVNHNHLAGATKGKTPHTISDMLDHKLQLSFLGPPLAALHSMTEMKAAQHQQHAHPQSHPNQGVHSGPGSPGGHQTAVSQTQTHSSSASNPHGIDTILSRPPPVTTAQLNALGGGMPRFTAAVAAAANMAQYLSQNHANGPMKAHGGPLVDRTHLYWPGLQGLVANPMAWRDRLGSSKYPHYHI